METTGELQGTHIVHVSLGLASGSLPCSLLQPGQRKEDTTRERDKNRVKQGGQATTGLDSGGKMDSTSVIILYMPTFNKVPLLQANWRMEAGNLATATSYGDRK